MIHELGGEAVAFYLAGGITGQAMEGLIEHSGIAAVRVPIAGLTRVSHTVYETSTGHEFRFTPEGPQVTEPEWRNCLEVLSIVDGDWFVASGSLARGLPDDFYARVARMVKERGGRDGARQLRRRPAPRPERGRLPGQAEPARARASARPQGHDAGRRGGPGARGGRQRPSRDRGADAGRGRRRAGHTGRRVRLASPEVEARSAVGAGDAFVGAMVWALANGRKMEEAFAYGVAAGAATAMASGTEHGRRADIERLAAGIQRLGRTDETCPTSR